MNQHQQIMAEIARRYETLRDAEIIGPSTLAHSVFERFSTGEESVENSYAALEHYKNMARKFLARHCDPDGEDNQAHGGQTEFAFSGKLQDRYPLPRNRNEDAAYKQRHLLTADERSWNVSQLRKSADARMEHADALEAEGQLVNVA